MKKVCYDISSNISANNFLFLLLFVIKALRENMEIQNKNDELQRELMQVRRESADRFNLQRTVEK